LSGPAFVGYWQSAYIYNTGGTLSLPALPATGTYTVIVDDYSYGVAATFALKLNAGTALIANGAVSNVTTTGAGQNPRFTFDVALGGTVGIGLTGLSYTPSDNSATSMTVYKPDGAYLLNATCYPSQNGCNLDLVNATVAGTYSVVVVPPVAVTSASFTMSLSAPVAGVLTIGSASGTAVTLTRAGQNARYTFTATAGQNIGVGLSELVLTPNTINGANLAVYGPDGLLLVTSPCYVTQTGCTLNLNSPVAGTYSVFASMTQAATGSFKLQANNDATGTLVANVASNVSLKPGQNARYTFSGTVGQSVGIELAQLVKVPNPVGGGSLNVFVYRPTDTISLSGPAFVGYWQSAYIYNTGGTLSLPALPATGTYTVIVDDTSYGVASTFALKAVTP
jgi:trimeric autotransporter adhesin